MVDWWVIKQFRRWFTRFFLPILSVNLIMNFTPVEEFPTLIDIKAFLYLLSHFLCRFWICDKIPLLSQEVCKGVLLTGGARRGGEAPLRKSGIWSWKPEEITRGDVIGVAFSSAKLNVDPLINTLTKICSHYPPSYSKGPNNTLKEVAWKSWWWPELDWNYGIS